MGVGKAAMLNVVHFTERYSTVMSMEKVILKRKQN